MKSNEVIFIEAAGDREALLIPRDNVAGVVKTTYDAGPNGEGGTDYFPEVRVTYKYPVDGKRFQTLRDAYAEQFLEDYAGLPF